MVLKIPAMATRKTTSAKKTPAKKTRKATRARAASKKPEKNTSPKHALKVIVKWGFVVGLWCAIGLTFVLAWYARELPNITEKAGFEKRPAIAVLDRRGNVAARYGEMQGDLLNTEDLPETVIQAVMATEDRRFYYHFGLDPIGLTRAMLVNAQAGRVVQGGSTLTQQLAKNLFLNQERTLKRKIQEAMLAVWLEWKLTKNEIMSAYLNRVYFGSGAYGIDAASELYFDKSAKDLNLRESATIASLLKAPSKYSPLNNPSLSRKRTDIVLGALASAGYITDEQVSGLTNLPPRPRSKPTGANAVRYYTDWIVDGLNFMIGTPEDDLVIKTTLDPKIQKYAEEALAKSLRANGDEKNISQGAVIVMRPDGAVLAMVGGRDYGLSQFNRVTQAKRSPGSSFKPFVYLTAFQHGWTPDDIIMDEPILKGRYRPKNYGGQYYGEVTIRQALAYSLNTVSMNLMKEVKPWAVQDTARSMGIISPLEPDLSLALGSSGVSMLEMATAYSVLANGGLSVFPYAIQHIKDKEGTLLYSRRSRQLHKRVVSPMHVDMMIDIMTGVVTEGSGRNANPGFPAVGKTGTSQDFRDAWFVGFSDELVVAVWMGNDDNASMKRVTGGSQPALVWREIMGKSRGRYGSVGDMTIREKNFSNEFENLISSWSLFGGGRDDDDEEDGTNWKPTSSRERKANTVRVPEARRYND
jgi:penicillin-binding protein 1A